MAWTGLALTVDGQNTLNNAQLSGRMQIKSVVIGDGAAPGNFRTLKGLVHQLYEVADLMVEKTDAGCTLTVELPRVGYDYYFREVGVVVSTDDGDKLYVYDNCGDDAQYIVSTTGVEATKKRIRISLAISDVAEITVVSPSLLYVAYDEFHGAVEELKDEISTLTPQDVGAFPEMDGIEYDADGGSLRPVEGGTKSLGDAEHRWKGVSAEVVDAGSVGKQGYIAYPDRLVYSLKDAQIHGYLSIRIPGEAKDVMLKFYVDIYDYVIDESVTYIISGYCYTEKGITQHMWYATSVQCLGRLTSSLANLNVRFGVDTGGYFWVTLGDADTTWSYPTVSIHDITYHLGFGTGYQSLNHDWGITLGPTSSGGIDYSAHGTGVREGNDNALGYYSKKLIADGGDNVKVNIDTREPGTQDSGASLGAMIAWVEDGSNAPADQRSLRPVSPLTVRKYLNTPYVYKYHGVGYWGFASPGGNADIYMRAPDKGFIPSVPKQSDGFGHGKVGTDEWPFLHMYSTYFCGTPVVSNAPGMSVAIIYFQKYIANSSIHDIPYISAGFGDDRNYTIALVPGGSNHYGGLTTGREGDYYNTRPGGDNMQNLGSASYRWKQIYAASSAVSTSDRTKKKNIKTLPDKLTHDFMMLIDAVSYEFIDGDSGRAHFGMTAQQIKEAMDQVGMTSLDFAGYIQSPKTREVEKEFEAEKEVDVYDAAGLEVIGKKTVKEKQKHKVQETIPGEYEYGLRYEEFIAPTIKMEQIHDRRLDEHAKTIADQQRRIDELRAENEALKDRLARIEAALGI